jgi:hypothetical protein
MIADTVSGIIAPEEKLSRFILQSNHFRKADNTVKQDAFIPHPREDLSVTRNLDLLQDTIWAIGEAVSQQTGKKLYGRAENQASVYLEHKLKIFAAPVSNNPYHANITGWPADKSAQKMIALEIAARACFVPLPNDKD